MNRYPQRDISAESQYVCQTLGIRLGPICVSDSGYQTGANMCVGPWVSDWQQLTVESFGVTLDSGLTDFMACRFFLYIRLGTICASDPGYQTGEEIETVE